MKNIKNIVIILILLVAGFVLSAFGMYQYNNYKTFKALTNQGQQYMAQKDYDKAIQTFQQALGYKNDSTIQSNLALAQNLKNENAKSATISKNIQLATEAAKNNKYDEANKYLDEIFKIDPNNSEAKNLKDTYTKTLQEQQTKNNTEENTQKQQQKTISSNTDMESQIKESLINNGEITYDESIYLLKKQYPDCSFKSINDAEGKSFVNRIEQENGRMFKHCYFFYGHNDKYDDELQGITAINRVSTHIYEIIPGYNSDYKVNAVK